MFKTIEQKCVSDIIIDQIKNMVYEGKLKAGDRLPSEKELGEQIGVSRASLREALKALKVMGIIESKAGGGNFVTNDFNGAVSNPLSLMVALNNTDSKKIFEFRQAIELGAVSLAAKAPSQEDLDDLQDIYDRMVDEEDDDRIAKLDQDFHTKIIDMSGNIFFKLNNNAIGEILRIFLKDSTKKSKKENILSMHFEVLEAIKDKDPRKAQLKMKKHLKQVERLNFK